MVALLSGCASAQTPPPIEDSEPYVTEQVAALLARAAQGKLAAEPLTDNARSALDAARMRDIGAALHACPALTPLALLARSTKGEERHYRYRAPCAGKPLLIDIHFGKGARVSHLNVRPA